MRWRTRRSASIVQEFVVRELKSDPSLSFAALKARAQQEGFNLYPVVCGRAKKALGLVAPKPHAAESKAEARANVPTPAVARHESDVDSAAASRRRGRTLGPTMSFIVAALQQNPGATNKEVTAAALQVGLKVTPHLMLRARKRLGLPGPRSTPSGRTGSSKPATQTPPPPPATRAHARSTGIRQLDTLIASIHEIEEERDRLRDALCRLAAVIKDVL